MSAHRGGMDGLACGEKGSVGMLKRSWLKHNLEGIARGSVSPAGKSHGNW